MSHFPVMVFRNSTSESVEHLLAPYDENLEMERYMALTKIQVIQRERESMQRYKEGLYSQYLKDPEAYAASCLNPRHLEYISKEFPKMLEWTDEQCYEEYIKYCNPDDIDEEGNVWSTSNPNAKWDWWSLGGRWTNAYKTKNGDTFTKSRVGNVNFSENIPFACVTPDGKWHESAKMGWFAITSDNNDSWEEDFLKLVSELNEDALVYVIDCHI